MRKPKKPNSPKLGELELTAEEVKERRAHAFWEMEAPLRDCSERAEIAEILIGQGRSDLADDIVYEIKDMLDALRADYRKGASTKALPDGN
jgi:hypothetical protein